MREASKGAKSALLPGSMCLIPACVRADAVRVVGVDAPEELGEIAAGAIVCVSAVHNVDEVQSSFSLAQECSRIVRVVMAV